jgi:hypothetical protein
MFRHSLACSNPESPWEFQHDINEKYLKVKFDNCGSFCARATLSSTHSVAIEIWNYKHFTFPVIHSVLSLSEFLPYINFPWNSTSNSEHFNLLIVELAWSTNSNHLLASYSLHSQRDSLIVLWNIFDGSLAKILRY